ncbi:MAG: endonuclease/exonuclease/phosphatase family protein [Verrucomicrobiaceae bacterium]|nr:endonuclease/exonuclease/phosphatase family protein [Verrucomicrobiaceae bacterium]
MPKVWVAGLFLLLAVPGFWWGRRWMGLLPGLAFFHAVVLLEWRTPVPARASSGRPKLRLVTSNRGAQDGASWVRWIAKVKPDVVAMQDVGGWPKMAALTPDVAGLPHLIRIGEHAVASRYPIRRTMPLAPLASITNGPLGYLPCLKVELDVEGRTVVVYSIHIRSPRSHFQSYRSWKVWRSPNRSAALSRYWIEQEKVLQMLLILIRAEKDPVVVVGDLNVPDVGPLYQEVTRTLQDAHQRAGQGYGYTFPGDLTSWLAGGAPWLRIDYILPDPSWRVLSCTVQDDALGSQHRAVLADLELR